MRKVIATIVIPGRPVVLKNSKQIIKVHGRRIIKSNPRVEAYQHRAIADIVKQWGRRPAITEPVGLRIIAYLAAGHDSGNLPDISNIYQCPEDLLQAAGVIEDDRQVEHHDGSRRVCMCDGPCPLKPAYKAGAKKGQLKPNCGAVKKCPFERLEIEISPAVPDVIESAGDYRPGGWEFWEAYDRDMISRCDEVAVLRLSGWENSTGVRAEIAIAEELGLPVRYLDPEAVPEKIPQEFA